MRAPAWSGKSLKQPSQHGQWGAELSVPLFIAQLFKNQYSPPPSRWPESAESAAGCEWYRPPGVHTWDFNLSLEVYFCVTHLVKQSEFTQLKKLCSHTQATQEYALVSKIIYWNDNKISTLLSNKYFKGHKQWLTLAKWTKHIHAPSGDTSPRPTFWDALSHISVFHKFAVSKY